MQILTPLLLEKMVVLVADINWAPTMFQVLCFVLAVYALTDNSILGGGIPSLPFYGGEVK